VATRAAPFDPAKSRFAKLIGITHRDQATTIDAPGYPGTEIGLRPLNPLESAGAHERARAWAKAHGFIPGQDSAERVRTVLKEADGGEGDAVSLGAIAGDVVELSHAIGREILLLSCIVPAGEDKGKQFFESVEDLCHWFRQPEQDTLLNHLREYERTIAPSERECTQADVEEVVEAAKKGLTRTPSDTWPVSMLRACVRTLAARLAKSTGST
jgi:hypothetical protein